MHASLQQIAQDGEKGSIVKACDIGSMQGLMRDPVIAADGHSYERAALESWLAQHDTSPVTGQPLPHKRIVDNVLIRNAISRHMEQEAQSSPQQQLRHCF